MSRFRPPLVPQPVKFKPAAVPVADPPPRMESFTPLRSGWATPPAATVVLGEPSGFIMALCGLYICMFMAPVSELTMRLVHFPIPLAAIVGGMLLLALLGHGGIERFWNTTIGRPWMLLLLFMVLAAATGTYRRASIPFIADYGLRYHLLPVYLCAFLISTKQVRYCMYWAAGGCILLLVLCAVFPTYEEGRMAVLAGSSLSNPNDLAFSIVLGLCCMAMLLYSKSTAARLLWIAAFPIALFFILRTASRANFVTILVLLPVIFILVSGRAKAVLALLAPLVILAIAIAVPHDTWTRLTLILSDPKQYTNKASEYAGAIGSQIARTELQKRAVELTLKHPLLGVGAGQFENAVEGMTRSETGKKSGWQEAHNTYLGLAAENGIPAFICYIISLFLCLKMNYSSYRLCQRDPKLRQSVPQSMCLFLFAVAFCVGITFSNSAYDAHVDVLVALSTANYVAIRRESKKFVPGSPAPALVPAEAGARF